MEAKAKTTLVPDGLTDIPINSAIHKAAGSLVTGRSLQNGKNVWWTWMGERSPETVLYGGRQSGGFVNRAVNVHIE